MLKRLRELRRDEHGMTFMFVGLGLIAFMAATTLAIDVGMFMNARTQAQTAADSAALAGATALVYNSWTDRTASGPAVQSAISAAQKNGVMAGTVDVKPTDVTFPNDPYGQANEVQVNVFRTVARNNPVSTLIGPLFGISTVDITATATAQAAPALGMTCVKPFIIPDKWQENNVPPNTTFDKYDNKGNIIPNADSYTAPGYTEANRGDVMVLRAQQGNNISPSMYYSWKMPGDIGGNFYEENIATCNTSVIEIPYQAQQEPGSMEGPTISGLQRLIDQDPTAIWDDSKKDYISTKRPSPRVFPIPLYDPDQYQKGMQTGRNATLVATNWLGFFLERIQGSEAYGRIFPITGVSAISGPTTTTPLAYVIRLVK
ncbi:MAG TPA: pilus assembly protein TadG-related protein [Vicinamibacterales bacterium]|jgi:Flp pilus assembly protein TadG|nr:pilus assembly protein TadG-related protein [Vicinamibacterales bacterium]